jgi:hypothetical protein
VRLFIAGALLSASGAQAARLYIERPVLCDMAEVVIIGEVTGQEVRWSAGDLGGLETWSDLSVTRIVRAPAPIIATLSVVTPGGVLNGLRMAIEDVAALHTDHRYLLLLSPTADGWRVVGGADGAIPLPHGDPTADAAAIESLGSCHAN